MSGPIKVAFITPSVSRSAGGIFEVELALARSLKQKGCEINVYGQVDENTQNDLKKWDSIPVQVFPSIGPHAFRYSPALNNAVKKSECNVAHLHVMWMYTSVVTNNWHKSGKPYITTIHGMLEPWALKNAGWKKKIVTLLYEGKCLKNASCIHAHTFKEYQDIRSFGLKNPVCIIPNGVDIPEVMNTLEKPKWYPKAKGRKVMLYLGRLHYKKGLENLLEAWAKVAEQHKDWCLVIAGWGEKEYMTALENKTTALGQQDNIIFAGPQFDQDKERTLTNSDAFILPSLSEGLPMAILEAWAYNMPALYTTACNIPEGYEHKAAIKIESAPDGLAQNLQHFFTLSSEERSAIGKNGYDLVLKKFTWNKVADQLAVVYKWLVDGGEKPEMVYLD